MKEAVGNNKTGLLIKEQRIKMGLSQSMLAEKMHVSREAVSKWENGHNLPDASIMLQLAERDVEELDLGEYIVRWVSITSNRFDSTAFKKTYNELYKQFTKQVPSRRFSIS